VLTDLSMPGIDGRQVSETLARYRPSVAVLCMSGNPDAVPHIGPGDTPVRVMLKPFTAEDLFHAVRDAITRAADLTAIAEDEIVRAHASRAGSRRHWRRAVHAGADAGSSSRCAGDAPHEGFGLGDPL
jgi:FixJ family two-component response regulator